MKIDSVAGTRKIDFNNFRGKKILIVNAASADSNFSKQYGELIQLYQLYKDKVVIVVVPSNSFGNEQGTDAQVAAKYVQNKPFQFPVTKRLNVVNPQISALYKWLTKKADNGLIDSNVKKAFYKYIIDKDGKLIASFNANVTPMNPVIQVIINK
jgi:glutathione peroxidase